jgi:ParB/RepB/Spo0J family partition protein
MKDNRIGIYKNYARIGTEEERETDAMGGNRFPASEYREDFPLDLLDESDKTFQPRFDYDEAKIRNLARDIEKYGQREPIGIRESPAKNGYFQIIYGFQRVKAVKQLGRGTTWARIYRGITEEECYELSIRDNEMRGDLTQVEKALQCKRLRGEGWTIGQLCEAYNTKKSTIYNWLKVTELDEITLGLIHHGYITVYHGLELAKVDFSRRLEDLEMILGWNLSVGDLERWHCDKQVNLTLGLHGWITNCLKDLRWKTIEKCSECEFHRGERRDGERRRLLCDEESMANHPEVVKRFLREVYGWDKE